MFLWIKCWIADLKEAILLFLNTFTMYFHLNWIDFLIRVYYQVSIIFQRLETYHCLNIPATAIIDGAVESPIYCVAVVSQKLGLLHVLPRL